MTKHSWRNSKTAVSADLGHFFGQSLSVASRLLATHSNTDSGGQIITESEQSHLFSQYNVKKTFKAVNFEEIHDHHQKVSI